MDVYTDGKDNPEKLFVAIQGTNFAKDGIINDLIDDSMIVTDTLEYGETFKKGEGSFRRLLNYLFGFLSFFQFDGCV